MIIKVLSENTSISEKLSCEHGLSLYIETVNHRLLFDTGASGLFAENAVKLGVDLKKVDTVIISHGHYDHGGGLRTFLDINKNAKVYFQEKAFEKHYSNRSGGEKAYIGLDEALLTNDRFIFCTDRLKIDDELELFSGVKAEILVPSGNADLFKKTGDIFIQDDFAHEQNLIINEGNITLLIAGCAHNGIINIVGQFNKNNGHMPDYVLGGFHLYSKGTKQNEAPDMVDKIGKFLLETNSKYYTCHCTGMESYNRLKAVMREKIDYISTGNQLGINSQGDKKQ
ncbi:MAG: MBL fold metallo-hydrolase [Oscillospiraceae bacterium]|nr:MBL fold metallo-hydrolase [Oscillospiraceae bacterium]